MEADWAVEIGPELPVIEGAWVGFVDLRSSPESVELISEAREYPALREALAALNGKNSPLYTTKCDVWTILADEIDPDEFSAANATARTGVACYIDVLERDAARFASFEVHEQRAREIAMVLRGLDLRRSRVDLVVRRAMLDERSGFGVTLYVAGCSSNGADAMTVWSAALEAAVAATISGAQPRDMGK